MALNVIFFIQQNEEITSLLYGGKMLSAFIWNYSGMKKRS